MTAVRALRIYCWVLAGLTLISWGAAWFNGAVLHLDYPWNWPLFDPEDRFTDFTEYYGKIGNPGLNGYTLSDGLPIFNYPAPALWILAFFIRLFSIPLYAYLVFSGIVSIIFFALVRVKVKSSRLIDLTVALTLLCSYPILFTLDRGNLEIALFAFVFAGVACFAGEAFWASAIFFALSACVKPFPVLFFYLFLTRKMYKQIAVAACIIVMLNLGALAWLGPNIPEAYAGVKVGFASALNDYMLGYREYEIPFDHCIFSCVKQAIRLVKGWPEPEVLRPALAIAYKIYIPLAGVLVLFSGWYFWRKPAMNQLFAILILVITTPPLSSDYTLLDVHIIWGVLLIHLVREGWMKRPLLFLVPLAILMTPQSYLQTDDFGFGGQVKTLMLLFLFVVNARTLLPSRLFGELPAPALAS